MPKLNLQVKHSLQSDEALKRIRTLLSEVKNQYSDKISNLSEKWSGNVGEFSFDAMGLSVSGTLEVKADSIDLKGNLPFAASFFRGKIESTIRERAEKLLA